MSILAVPTRLGRRPASQLAAEPDRSCLMSAWQLMKFGKIDQLELTDEAPKPILKKPKDVLVHVKAASLNPLDLAMIGGYGNVLLDAVRGFVKCQPPTTTLPLILGRDFCGQVVAKGTDVSDVRVGDTVYGVVPPHQQGTHAEYVVTDSFLTRVKPSHLTDEEAAGILYTGMTAWSSLKITGDLFLSCPKNHRALVIGGAGGVGIMAVQLLKNWGVEVVTTCATDAVPLLESLGADVIVDYTKPDAMKDLQLAGKYDIILDCSGTASPPVYVPFLREWHNAKFITLRSPLLKNFDSLGLVRGAVQNAFDMATTNFTTGAVAKGTTVRWGYFLPVAAGVDEISSFVNCKKMIPVVDKIYDFNQMPAAFEKLEQGHLRGKIIVTRNEIWAQETPLTSS